MWPTTWTWNRWRRRPAHESVSVARLHIHRGSSRLEAEPRCERHVALPDTIWESHEHVDVTPSGTSSNVISRVSRSTLADAIRIASRLQAKPYGRLCPGWDLVLWSLLELACRELLCQRLNTLGCAADTQQREAEMRDAIEDAMQGSLVR